jgi:predicted nucleic acid-binding protein
LLKLFVVEIGSANMVRFATQEDDRNKIVSCLTHVEASSAICRLRRSKHLTSVEADAALNLLNRDIKQMAEQPVSLAILDTAKMLVDRHYLRALDAIQLATAIAARGLLPAPDLRFIASDKALKEAALAEGFEVWDPALA